MKATRKLRKTWFRNSDVKVFFLLSHCPQCGVSSDNGKICKSCHSNNNRHDAMLADAAWLGHTY
jgi:ribosomal protein L32